MCSTCGISKHLAVSIFLLLLAACAADPPTIPPTELVSIKPETRLTELWAASVGKTAGARFAPFVSESAVVVASLAGRVSSYAIDTGKLLWRVELSQRLGSGVSGDADRVYISTADGLVQALDALSGENLWSTAASSEVLVPVSAGYGAVVVRSADGRIMVLDPDSGEQRWSVSYTPPALTLNGYSRPLLLEGGVLVGLDDGRLLALDLDNGREIWETILSVPTGRSEIERLVDIDANVLIDKSAIYVVNYQGRLARVEPARGQIVWSVPLSSTAGLALLDDVIVVVDDEDTLHGIDKKTGQQLWIQEALRGRRLTTPKAFTPDGVLVGDLEGFVHVIARTDGRLIGRTRLSQSAIQAEPILRDDVVYVQTTDGTVSALYNKQ